MKSIILRIFIATLAVIIAGTFVLSVVPGVQSYAQADMSDSKAIYEFLTKTGIIDETEIPYSRDGFVKRAEFVKLALLISNDAPKVLVSEGDIFTDVKSGDPYEAYIETAKKIGYISGANRSLFNPNDYITLSQAVKILSNILGYSMLAEELGGYPTGYLTVARRYGLLNDDHIYADGNLTMEDVWNLLYSALSADMMEINSMGDTISVKVVPDTTLLSSRHHIEKAEGVIEANIYTDLYDANGGLITNQIKLGNSVYKLSNIDIANMLGYKVTLFYEKSDNGALPEAVFALLSDDNTIISAVPGDLATDGDDLIYYDDDTRRKRISFSDGLTFIYNKKMSIMNINDMLGLENAFITLVSNDGDNDIDVIIIDSYTIQIINGVDATNSVIRTADGSVYDISGDSKDCVVVVSKDGVTCGSDSIVAGDSALVCCSADLGITYLEILLSSKTINITPVEIGDDYIISDDVRYEVSTRLLNTLALGKTYKSYIDAFGRICYVELQNNMVYGFLNAVDKREIDNPMCHIFTENNRWVELYFARNIKYNGSTVAGDSLYQTLAAMGDDIKQLIRYRVNADGEVIVIETATSVAIGSADEKEAIENNTFRESYSGKLNWRNAVKSFNGMFFLESNAKVFYIPADYRESDFSVKSSAALTTNGSYTVTAYDIDDNLSCPVIVVDKLITSNFSSADNFMVVKSVGKAINAEGDAVTSVRVYRKGYEVVFTAEQSIAGMDAEISALNKGDVIIAKFDEDNDIHYINKYDMDNVYYINDSVYDSYSILGGEVLSYDTSLERLKLCYQASGDIAGILVDPTMDVHVYEKARGNYYMDKAMNIIPGDKILVYCNYLNCKELVVIRP